MFVELDPPVTDPVTHGLALIEQGLDAIQLADYARQSPEQARHNATALRRIESRLKTHAGAAVRAVASNTPGKTASQKLARDFGNDQRAARRELKDADTLADASLTERAAADGKISHRHATVIGNALNDLPPDATPQQRGFAERALIRDAGHLSPEDLAQRGRRITDQYKPDPDDVDADEDRLLRRREAMARANTSFQLWDNHDGTWSFKGRVPELHGRTLKTTVDAYTALPDEPTSTQQPIRSNPWTSARARPSAPSSNTSPPTDCPPPAAPRSASWSPSMSPSSAPGLPQQPSPPAKG